MGRKWVHRLTVREITALAVPGLHHDGQGLYLRVSTTGAKSWIWRYQHHGKRHDRGLGSAEAVGLKQARDLSAEMRVQLRRGEVPLPATKQPLPILRSDSLTWGSVAEDYISRRATTWKNAEKASAQWIASLKRHGPEWAMLVSDVTDEIVVDCLSKIWATKHETAARVRNRIELIWDYAAASKLVSGANPARKKGWIDAKLPPIPKSKRSKPVPSLPYAEMPRFWAELQKRTGKRAEALRFLILTATRTSEVTGFTWPEVEGSKWVIPARRMKVADPFVVPLSKEARAILDAQDKLHPTPFLLSENTMLFLIQKKQNGMGYGKTVSTHGFRSTFATWATEQTDYPQDLIQFCLSHQRGNAVTRVYTRGTLIEKRRSLMQDWANYCLSNVSSSVT